MIQFLARRRFNYIDSSQIVLSVLLLVNDQFLWAAASLLVGSIVSVTVERWAKPQEKPQ